MLTAEAIRKNPWNAVFQPLPETPGRMLLLAAHMAATHCRDSEFRFLDAARRGKYTPPEWEEDPENASVHIQIEERWFAASRRCMEISRLHASRFGEPLSAYDQGWEEYFG